MTFESIAGEVKDFSRRSKGSETYGKIEKKISSTDRLFPSDGLVPPGKWRY
jgi:hypothetical protein